MAFAVAGAVAYAVAVSFAVFGAVVAGFVGVAAFAAWSVALPLAVVPPPHRAVATSSVSIPGLIRDNGDLIGGSVRGASHGGALWFVAVGGAVVAVVAVATVIVVVTVVVVVIVVVVVVCLCTWGKRVKASENPTIRQSIVCN